MSKNKMAKKVLASSAALCLVLSSTSFAASAATIAPEKLGGDNRFDTAIKIAEASWKDAWKGSKNAILASGNQANLVDALAVAPLAYELKAPILLDDANKDVVNEDTLKALKDNGVTKVYIATGTGVISEKAEAQLKEAGMEVVRLGGASRYDTAENILDEFKKNGGKVDTVALVAGTGLADALSVAPVAAKQGMPILLTNGKDKVAANLEDVAKAAKKIYAVGGDGIIADALVKDLKAERLGGANRFDTNAAVVKAFAKDGKVKFDKVYFAEGINGLVDALTGSVLAAQSDAPVVLTNNKLDKMADTKAMLKENVTDKTELNAFGKTVVEDSFLEDVKDVKNEGEDGEVKVDSVSALNLHQVKVSFSGKVDEDDATKAGNYEVRDEDDHKVEIDTAELDGNDVILTFKDKYETEKTEKSDFDKPAIENQTKIDVTVESTVFGGDKDYKAEDIKMTDTELPEVEDVKVVGSDTIKLKFSEPIKPDEVKREKNSDNDWEAIGYYADKKAFEVKSGDGDKYYVKEVQLFKNNTEANVVLYSDLKIDKDSKQGKVSVKVNGDVKDYADFGLVTNAIESEFEKDEEKPYVTGYKDVKSDEVTLIFNEDVRLTDDLSDPDYKEDFYHTNSKNHVKDNGVTIDGNEVTLKFDSEHKLPDGTSYIMINDGALEDLWGNEINAVRQEVERVEDKTKPEVNEVKQGDNEDEIKVKFSEKVQDDDEDNGAENKDNYTLLNEDGKELKNKIKRIALNGDDDEATITLKEDLDAGDYSLVIENIADQSENKNKLEKVTKDFKMTDKTNPNEDDDFEAKLYNAGKDDQKIVVNFKEKMATEGKYAVNDLNNYQLKIYDGTKLFKTIDLDDYDDAAIDVTNNGKSVEIQVPFDDDDDDSDKYDSTHKYNEDNNHAVLDYEDKLVISRVADASDNTTPGLVNEITLSEASKVAVESTKATDTDTVEVEFDGKVDLDTDDIRLNFIGSTDYSKQNEDNKELDDVSKSVKTKINDDGNTVLVITLKDDYELEYTGTYDTDKKTNAADDEKDVRVVVVGQDSKNEYDRPLMLSSEVLPADKDNYKVEDKIAPELAKYDEDTAKKVAKEDLGIEDEDEAIKKLKDEDMVKVYFDDKDGKVKVDLTFEEDIDETTVSASTFEIDNGDYDIDNAIVNDDNTNVVTLTLDGYDVPDEGASITKTSVVKDGRGNELDDLDAEVSVVKKGTVDAAKAADTKSSDKDDVERAEKNLAIKFADEDSERGVTKAITLPTEQDGCKVTWESDTPAVIANDGKVTRPAADDTEVTLTATIKKGEVVIKKEFKVTVKKA